MFDSIAARTVFDADIRISDSVPSYRWRRAWNSPFDLSTSWEADIELRIDRCTCAVGCVHLSVEGVTRVFSSSALLRWMRASRR